MKAAGESVASSDTAPVQNPAAVYLHRLHPSGRRSMRRELDCAVAIFTDEAVTDATAFDWSQISRRQVAKLRSVMVDHGAAAGTVNHMLSGVRSTVRIAWELGLVDDKTRIAVEDEPNEKPQQRRRAGRYARKRSTPGSRAAATGRAPCCARSPRGGRIQPRDMTAQAVMVRVRTIAEQAGVDLVTPERSTPDVLDRAGEAAPRRPDEGQARRVTGTRDAVRSVPSALIRSSRRGVHHTALRATKAVLPEHVQHGMMPSPR